MRTKKTVFSFNRKEKKKKMKSISEQLISVYKRCTNKFFPFFDKIHFYLKYVCSKAK